MDDLYYDAYATAVARFELRLEWLQELCVCGYRREQHNAQFYCPHSKTVFVYSELLNEEYVP